MTTPYSLKGLPVIIQVSFSYNNQDWEPIRTWQLCSPRASIHSVLHVREPQTRFRCRVAVQSLEPDASIRSGFQSETSGAEVKVRSEIFSSSGLSVLFSVSVVNPSLKNGPEFHLSLLLKSFLCLIYGTRMQSVRRRSSAGKLSVQSFGALVVQITTDVQSVSEAPALRF